MFEIVFQELRRNAHSMSRKWRSAVIESCLRTLLCCVSDSFSQIVAGYYLLAFCLACHLAKSEDNKIVRKLRLGSVLYGVESG